MPGHRADDQLVAVDADVVQFGEIVDVDDTFRLGDPQPHHRNQAVPSGDEPGFGPVPFQQGERLVDGMGLGVVNGCRSLHARPLLSSRWVTGLCPPRGVIEATSPRAASARDGGSDGPARQWAGRRWPVCARKVVVTTITTGGRGISSWKSSESGRFRAEVFVALTSRQRSDDRVRRIESPLPAPARAVKEPILATRRVSRGYRTRPMIVSARPMINTTVPAIMNR